MALITSSTIIRSLSLFHLTLAFFFLASPITVADQSLVFIMGEAMGLPHSRAFDAPSAPLSLLAAVLFVYGLGDLVAVSLQPALSLPHFAAQAPVRLSVFFCLGLYSFCFSARSPMYKGGDYVASGWGEGLKDRVVFSWAFVEMIAWYWVWMTLRDERREAEMREMEKQRREEGSL